MKMLRMITRRKLLLAVMMALFNVAATAQPNDPVHLTMSYKKLSPRSGELHIVTTIDAPWHIYAQVQPKDAVGEPTLFTLKPNPLVKPIGKWKELGKKETYHNEEVGITQYHYAKRVEFVLPVQLKAAVKTAITGSIRYQACTDEQCQPTKTVRFTIALQ